MPDWKKEIKLSDLVRRGEKKPKAKPEAVEAVAAPDAGEKKSFLKKDLSFSRRRRAEGPSAEGVRTSFLKKDISFSRRRRATEGNVNAELADRTLSRAEARAAKKEARAAAKAANAATRKAPKLARRSAAAPPAVPLMRAFDLLPRDAETQGRRLSPAQLVLAVAALVAIAGLGAYFLTLNAKVADRRAERDDLKAAAAAHPVPAQAQQPQPDAEENQALKDEQSARTAALAGALGKRVAWDRLLREFSLVVPDGVSLTKLTASGGGTAGADSSGAAPPATPTPDSTFTIEGYARTQRDVANLLARLSVLPELKDVKLENATKSTQGGETVVQFSIQTTVKPTAGATA